MHTAETGKEVQVLDLDPSRLKSLTKESWIQSQVGQYKLEFAWTILFYLLNEKNSSVEILHENQSLFLKKED